MGRIPIPRAATGHNPVGVEWFGAPMTQGSVAPRRNPGLWDAIPLGLDAPLLCQRHSVPKPRVGLRHEGLPWDMHRPMNSNPNGVVSGVTLSHHFTHDPACHATIPFLGRSASDFLHQRPRTMAAGRCVAGGMSCISRRGGRSCACTAPATVLPAP
jgi:hypothetical protein